MISISFPTQLCFYIDFFVVVKPQESIIVCQPNSHFGTNPFLSVSVHYALGDNVWGSHYCKHIHRNPHEEQMALVLELSIPNKYEH